MESEYALFGLTFFLIALGLLTAFYLCYLRYRQMQEGGLEALLVQQEPEEPAQNFVQQSTFRDRRRGWRASQKESLYKHTGAKHRLLSKKSVNKILVSLELLISEYQCKVSQCLRVSESQNFWTKNEFCSSVCPSTEKVFNKKKRELLLLECTILL